MPGHFVSDICNKSCFSIWALVKLYIDNISKSEETWHISDQPHMLPDMEDTITNCIINQGKCIGCNSKLGHSLQYLECWMSSLLAFVTVWWLFSTLFMLFCADYGWYNRFVIFSFVCFLLAWCRILFRFHPYCDSKQSNVMKSIQKNLFCNFP